MTEKFEAKCSPTNDQIAIIVIAAMLGTAKQYASYANDLKCSHKFIVLMLRHIADSLEK